MSTIVRGAVSGRAMPLRGRRVAVITWSPRSSTSLVLGQAFTDRHGRYEVAYDEAASQGRLAVCVVDLSGRILAASGELSNLPRDADIDLVVGAEEVDLDATQAMAPEDDTQEHGTEEHGTQDADADAGAGAAAPHQPPPAAVHCDYSVSGTVTWADGTAVVGAVVRAVDRDLRGEQPLGPFAPGFRQETRTDACGRYRIEYHREQYTHAEFGTADLVVRVLGGDGKPVAASPVHFNVPDHVSIDLVVTGAVPGQPSEWERVVAVVQQVIDDPEPAPLDELLPGDLDFLAGETGIARDKLSALLDAVGLSRDARAADLTIAPEAFYGLIREGLSAGWTGLAAHPAADLAAALTKAAGADGIIPAALGAPAAQLAADIEQAAAHAGSAAVAQTATLADPAVRYATTGTVADPLVDARLDAALTAAATDAVATAAVAAAAAAASATAGSASAGTPAPSAAAPAKPSDALTAAVAKALSAVRWQDQAGGNVADVARSALAQAAADPALAAEAEALSQALPPQGTAVADALYLTQPVRDNPLLTADVRQGIAVQLAGLGGLSAAATGAVAANSAGLFDAPETTLGALRDCGALTDTEAATLRNLLDLGNLTDHHATVLQSLVSQGATTPHELAGWDAQRWTQLLNTAQAQPPPDESVEDYAANLVANLEHTHPTQALAARLAPGDPHLATLYGNNPDLDLRSLDIATSGGLDTLNWQGIPDTERAAVTRQLAAHERLLVLGHDTDTRTALAAAGFDSALRITAHTEDAFLAASGLSTGTGRMVYARAHDLALNVAHLYGCARDVLTSPFDAVPAPGPGTGDGPSFVNDLLRIQGMSELFGSQDYCRCSDCQSVLSPAAYFVDLMHFTDKYISQPTFAGPGLTTHPLYLKNRRADLWTLQLTCANTNTLVPYLTVVDKVLEDWIDAHALPAGQSDIYTVLSDPAQKFSCQVPFSLPYAELGLYLGYFTLTPADVYRVLRQPDAKVRRAAAGLSPDEAAVVATPDPAGITHRLGDPPTLDLLHVEAFLRRLDITREQLTAILASRYAPDLAGITVVKVTEPGSGEIQNFPEALQGLTAARADVIHRLVRLWRPLPWSLPELDLVLFSLKQAGLLGADLTESAIELVGRLLTLQQALGVTVEQLCALSADMPVSTAFPATPAVPADRMLYESVFDLRGIFGPADPAQPLNPSAVYYHYALDTTLGGNPPVIDPKTPLLLAGLGISETELLLLFALLKNEMPFDPGGHATLQHHTLSLLYRHVLLARMLGYSVQDLVTALALVFPPPASGVIGALDQIDALLAFHHWQTASPFTIPQLQLILTGTESRTTTYANTPATVAALVLDIQNSGVQPRLDALRTKLATAFNVGAALLEQMLAWSARDITAPDIQAALDAPFTGDAPNNPNLLLPLVELIHQLERAALLFATLKLKDPAIAYLTANAPALGTVNIKALTLRDVQAVAAYAAQADAARQATQAPDAETSVQQLLSGYRASGTFDAAARARLASLRQVDRSLIDSIVAAVPLPPVPIDALTRLDEVFALCRTMSVNAYSLQKLGQDATFAQLADAAAVAVGAVGAQYKDDAARDGALEPYQDRVNTLKRDALCGYLIDGRPALNFLDHNEIYDYFLLDVDMSGCARTSWVVAAVSSVQLYVQRCLAALEQSDPDFAPVPQQVQVAVPDVAAKQWEWRKYFRVWQANRKVFLNPESYIDPDLRDDKTPIFTDLEADLLQKPITKDTGEDAFHRYLARLSEVAHLRVCGSYYDATEVTYYFFARTQADPPVFYYRTWDTAAWTPWTRIDLAIEAKWVSAIKHQGRLYLFWSTMKFTEHTSFSAGASHDDPTTVKIGVSYSALKADGKWLAPQKLDWLYPIDANNQIWWWENALLVNMPTDKVATTAYPVADGGDIVLRYANRLLDGTAIRDRKLDLFHNQLVNPAEAPPSTPTGPAVLVYWSFGSPRAFLGVRQSTDTDPASFDLRRDQYHDDPGPSGYSSDFISGPFPFTPYAASVNGDPTYMAPIQAVNNGFPESVLSVGYMNQQYLIHERAYLELGRFTTLLSSLVPHYYAARSRAGSVSATVPAALPPAIAAVTLQPVSWWWSWRQLVRLSTSVVDDLGRIDAESGVEGLLSLASQYLWGYEYPIGFTITNEWELLPPDDDPDHVDVRSTAAYGTYFQELFLHLPWMMAHQLNAAGRYEDAMWWYRRLFDPMSTDTDTDRVWRYAGFRGLSVPSLRDILTDQAALNAYRNNPFNPFAIARLRPVAFQKALVMAFVDNLIDWGDSLFAQDTTESVNEATMLYVLAAEILGPRPVELGDCALVPPDELTYEQIGPSLNDASDFLVTLENWSYHSFLARTGATGAQNTAAAFSKRPGGAAAAPARQPASEPGPAASLGTSPRLLPYAYAANLVSQHEDLSQLWNYLTYEVPPATEIVTQSDLVFCVPPDEVQLGYWDRVQDRLDKIRNCMNLSGVRRQLALFAPPINPMDLVRARAAGLSIEEAVAAVSAPAAPAYRFTAIIDRARQAAQTVAAFGGSLLSALEKKDAEELTLLRSVHERTVLRMTRDVKAGQLAEAQFLLQAALEQEANVQNRIDYYQGLINNGLSGWEKAEADARTTASILRGSESALYILAAILHLIPSAGSPFAMVFGGKDIGPSQALATQAIGSLAATAESVATAAAVGAGHDRRSQEWKQQLTLAQQELKQVAQQRQAAETRAGYAQRELDVHQTQMDQADELDEFYRDKFTSLGLYTYQARTLTRLHRQAYDAAYQLALAAQYAYAFELDDTASFIAPDNWESAAAGLLSGERLQLQLQQLENAYLAKNTRRFEVSQSFPLSLVDPAALLTLRATGTCTFTVPELLFDLLYPGQYKRLVKSVRLTIPGVTGPYTNIGAKLSLTASAVRLTPSAGAAAKVAVPPQPNIAGAIATSTALNDAGLFELSFRDDRYLPFEGAGAVDSAWTLQLPSQLRAFDYDTISDVVLQIGYTALDDGAFRTAVENDIVTRLTQYAGTTGLLRTLSLRHDFPAAWQQLTRPAPGGVPSTSFDVTAPMFPYFLSGRTLARADVGVYLQPAGTAPVDTTGLAFTIDGTAGGAWHVAAGTNLATSDFPVTGPALATWTVNVTAGRIDVSKIEDVLLLVRYTAT